jgi:hypothetical protein
MWQGWITFLAGLWLTISSFFWTIQTRENLIITGIVTLVFGFWASKEWEGVMLGMLGIWVLGSGLANYLDLPINYALTGISIVLVALFCSTVNLRLQLTENAK